jgi:dTDP-4-amino-4,6-dideoxygalactose transaminase
VDIGSSYLPSDILAAMLYAQLEARSVIQAQRRLIWERYYAGLERWARELGVGLPVVPPYCDQAYHMFYMVMPSLEARQALIEELARVGINAVFHYQPLHLSTMGARFGGRPGDCPISEGVSDRLVRLPFFNDITPEDQKYIVDAITRSRA